MYRSCRCTGISKNTGRRCRNPALKDRKRCSYHSFAKRSKNPRKKSKWKLVKIGKSPVAGKKLQAIFQDRKTGKTKKVSFGATGYSDYTKHKDAERKRRYLARHKARENWNNVTSAGALSRWILWNKTSLQASISDFKKRFGLGR